MSSLGQGIKECPTKTTQLTSLVNGHLKVRTFGRLRDSVWIMKQDASLSVEKVNLSTSTQAMDFSTFSISTEIEIKQEE